MLEAFFPRLHRTEEGDVISDISSLRENPRSCQETLVRDNGGWGKDFLLSWCCTWQSFTLLVTTPSTFLCIMYTTKTSFISLSTTKSYKDWSGKPKEDTGKVELPTCTTLGRFNLFPSVSRNIKKNPFCWNVKICQMTSWSSFKCWQSS